ncbi:MAG: hypothetical protein IT186_23425 [Acidobacteria bacterium]|nr:hypothetical protein [Acidobacteriota bacterium]MCG3191788.1 hypothetical protein [Thermoanaerobaculia bacterium]
MSMLEGNDMKRISRVSTVFVLVAAIGFLAACNNNDQGDSADPIYLTVNFQLLPATKNVGDGTLLQFSSVVVRSVIKNPSSGSSNFLDTRIDDYIIEWSRVDGGTKAPASEVFAGNVIVPAGATTTLSNYPFMSISALSMPPLDQLFPYNGGIDRETGKSEIRAAGKVTFRGRTYAGNKAEGSGIFNMTFIYSGTAGRVAANVNRTERPGALSLLRKGLAFAF